jgi:hypothetical protein
MCSVSYIYVDIVSTHNEEQWIGALWRGAWVNTWAQTPWVTTRIHDYTGHVKDEQTNAAGGVEW